MLLTLWDGWLDGLIELSCDKEYLLDTVEFSFCNASFVYHKEDTYIKPY